MPNRLLLLGHRGARATQSLRENSIASFQRTLEHGCDGFEFDVRRAADGSAVICHDPVWRSGSAGSRGIEIAGGALAELPGIATLADVFQQFSSKAYLDIELKVGGVERDVVDLIRSYPPRKGFVVSSFLPEVLERLAQEAPEVPLGLICDTRPQLERWDKVPSKAVIPQFKLVTRELVRKLHDAGKQVLVWTVNESDRMKELADWGVDGLISDETELLAKTFAAAR